MDEDILFMILAFVVVAVPVCGFTMRFAINPVLIAMLRLRESAVQQAEEADERMINLTREVQRLAATVERLEEGADFERRLAASAGARRQDVDLALPPS